MNIKHLVIGDVHGHFHNLRQFLLSQGAINAQNERINKDKLGVYCTGDLIDGDFNRAGDHLLLEHAAEWFDKICIGNHEFAFIGGPDFGGKRQHDRALARRILALEHRGIYVPAWEVEDYLLVHAGLAARWSFRTAHDALEAINFVWNMSNQEDAKDYPMLDWIGPGRAGKWAEETGGIFWLDWSEKRNLNINQIVGHSTIPSGPEVIRHGWGVEHWNIDTGGKTGYCLGAVMIENGKAEPLFWGQRFRYVTETQESTGKDTLSNDELWNEVDWDLNDLDKDEVGPYDAPYSFEKAVSKGEYSFDPAEDFSAMCKGLMEETPHA